MYTETVMFLKKWGRCLVSGMKITLQSTRKNSWFAPLDLHILNAFVAFVLAYLASVPIWDEWNRAVRKSFFTLGPRQSGERAKKVKVVGGWGEPPSTFLFLPHFLCCPNAKKLFFTAREARSS